MKKIILFGCLPVIILSVACVVGVVMYVNKVGLFVEQDMKGDPVAERAKNDALSVSQASDLQPSELAKIYRESSYYTNFQRANKTKEITGKIVEWTLEVQEVDALEGEDESYKIETEGASNEVRTVICIHQPDAFTKQRLEEVQLGDLIRVKGVIKGVSADRKIEIDPAILIPYDFSQYQGEPYTVGDE